MSDYINREMAADCIVLECDGVTLEQARHYNTGLIRRNNNEV